MITCAVLKQAGRYYNYIVPKICHAQFYTVKSGALMSAGNCVAGSVFFVLKTGGVPSIYSEHECPCFNQPGGDENIYKLEKNICCWDDLPAGFAACGLL